MAPLGNLLPPDGEEREPEVLDVRCPACGHPAAHHGSSANELRCRLSPDFIRRVGTMSPSDLHGGPIADAACRDKDHNADISTFGACNTCASDEKIEPWRLGRGG